MTWTDAPQGSRPNCSSCGKQQWAAAGYCLSIECAGHYKDPDYPKSMPQHLKDERDARLMAKGGKKSSAKKPTTPKVRMPRKGTRRSTELWYESQGKVAPWLEKQGNDPNAS